MQGMKFLLVNEQGPINHGIIQQQITPEKYLCTFVRDPQVSRVVDIEEIQQWNLFPTDETMNAFIVELQKNNPVPTTATPPEPPKKKKVTKKKKVSVKK